MKRQAPPPVNPEAALARCGPESEQQGAQVVEQPGKPGGRRTGPAGRRRQVQVRNVRVGVCRQPLTQALVSHVEALFFTASPALGIEHGLFMAIHDGLMSFQQMFHSLVHREPPGGMFRTMPPERKLKV